MIDATPAPFGFGEVQAADEEVHRRGGGHVRPRDPQQVADQDVLEVLGPLGLLHHQDGHGAGDRIGQADDRLLGDLLVAETGHREDRRAEEGEGHREEERPGGLGHDAEDEPDGGAESGDLGQGQVDEDDPALEHVDAEIGVDRHQDETFGERRRHQL